MYKIKQIEIDFFESALVKDSTITSINEILEWINQKNKENSIAIKPIPLDKLQLWNFDETSGNIVHKSERFFSIEGLRIETNWGNVSNWSNQ